MREVPVRRCGDMNAITLLARHLLSTVGPYRASHWRCPVEIAWLLRTDSDGVRAKVLEEFFLRAASTAIAPTHHFGELRES